MNPLLARAALSASTSRTARRVAGCGCLGLVALAGLPMAVAAALWSGALDSLPRPGSGVTAVGGGVLGSGEPLPPGSFVVSQGFGCTPVLQEAPPPPPYACPSHPWQGGGTRFHTGIDLAAPRGTPVYAVSGGIVHVVAGSSGFGLHEVIDAGGGLAYLYGHLGTTLVADGSAVAPGSLIGFVGSTGNSSGPHLHFEVDSSGVPVNPCAVFPPGYLVPAGTAALDCLEVDLSTP
ncbi:MAG: M23 family metallopeptidase [Candidatus Dormibacteria bacterium]